MRIPIDPTTARVLNRLGALGATRLEGQRGYVGQRLDIGYPECWCGLMPAEHVTPHVSVSDCCSECADTGTTFDDNDRPIQCPRCHP